jgi:hypothetical protein
MVAAMVLSTIPTDSMSWLRKLWWVSVNSPKEASSITALHVVLEERGQDDDEAGRASPRPEEMRTKSGGTLLSTSTRLSAAACPISPSRAAIRASSCRVSAPVGGRELEVELSSSRVVT